MADWIQREAAEGKLYYPRWRNIEHYYGDLVRALMLATAILILVGAPFYADDLKFELPFILAGAIILVALAAMTTPKSRLIMRLDAVAAGTGAVLYEMWALWGFGTSSPLDFVMREAPAIILLVAFYFALKTLRAMLSGMIGVGKETTHEFDFKRAAEEEIRERSDGSADSARRPDAFDAHMEPTDDGLGHTPAKEDDSGGD